MARIGVIIPVYNVEPYLKSCIDSIVNQTFQDFELLLIDDGSTDGSGTVCDMYAQKDERIRVFHQKHLGVSAGRNKGLEENRCEYIAFIDGDDYVDRRYLEVLYQMMIRYDGDMVISGATDVWQGKKANREKEEERHRPERAEVISRQEAYRRMFLCIGTSVTLWANLYRERVLRKIRFPVGEIHEETKVLEQIIEGCGKIVYVYYSGYCWRMRKGSLLHGRISDQSFSAARNARHLWRFMEKNYPDVEEAAKIFYINTCLQLFNLMILDSEKRYDRKCMALRRKLIRETRFFLFNRNTHMVDKGGMLCLWLGVPCYRLIYLIYLHWTKKDTTIIWQ